MESKFSVYSLYNIYCSWSTEVDNYMIFLHWTEIRECVCACVCVCVCVCVCTVVLEVI